MTVATTAEGREGLDTQLGGCKRRRSLFCSRCNCTDIGGGRWSGSVAVRRSASSPKIAVGFVTSQSVFAPPDGSNC